MDAQKPSSEPTPKRAWQWLVSDPRHGQIATLGTLLVFGMSRLGFDIGVPQVSITLASVPPARADCVGMAPANNASAWCWDMHATAITSSAAQ